MVVTVGFEAV